MSRTSNDMFIFRDLENPRYERKAYLTELGLEELCSIVKEHPAAFREAYPERRVNNLYLDTASMTSYLDNVDGLANRLKVRVRWYGSLFGEITPVLEFKIKQGFVGYKKSYQLPVRRFVKEMPLDERDLFEDANLPPNVLKYVETLQFTLLNSYLRRYFESADHRFRITLDYDMEFYKLKRGINRFTGKYSGGRAIVFELKYPHRFDELAESISNYLPFRLTKSSKYVSGINAVNGML